MQFSEPIPFEEAIAKLRERGVLPLDFDSFQWSLVPVAIRERAFFSSRVESARVLQAMKDHLEDYLSEDRAIEGHGGLRSQGRAEFVANMRELAIRQGLGKVDPETGEIDPNIHESDLTDIRSIARLQLIFDNQVEAAQEYGYWQQGNDPAILDVFPAQRFIRIRPVLAPRPYHAANEGAVKRKDDLPFWLSMNRDFGVPWGPWGFNSGMGVEDVDREEAEALGLIRPDERIESPEKPFNDGLQAGIQGIDPGIADALRRATGGTTAGGRLKARVMPRNTRLDPELVKRRIESLARPDAVDVSLLAKLPDRLPFTSLATVQDIQESLRAAGAVFPPTLLKGRRFEVAVKSMPGNTAGTYQKGKITLSEKVLSNPAELRLTMLHEITHAIMDDSPGAAVARRKIAAHFDKRTRGEKPVSRNGKRYLRDKWRVLEAGLEDGGEVASYYVEMLGFPPEHLAKLLADRPTRETFELVLGALGIERKSR